jgi:hypothetical protein
MVDYVSQTKERGGRMKAKDAIEKALDIPLGMLDSFADQLGVKVVVFIQGEEPDPFVYSKQPIEEVTKIVERLIDPDALMRGAITVIEQGLIAKPSSRVH